MSSKYKVLLYEPIHSEATNLLKQKCDLVYAESFEEESLIRQARDVDAIISRGNCLVTRAIIQAASRLRVIGKHGAGLDKIELRAAKEYGISVVYTPTANTESVAEHFVGLLLMLAKKLRLGDMALRAGKWKASSELLGTELYGKVLGIMGFGNVGQQVARICVKGFGMTVLYYDIVNCPGVEKELGAKPVSLRQLFSEADVISINLPLVPQTRGLVNGDLIKLMKPTAFLINVARGPIWNEADILRALNENWIAGAGSDVFEMEPPSPDNPLFKVDNFVGTPHLAANTKESLIRMSMVARDILAVLEGREPEFPVPEVYFDHSKR